MTDDRTPPENLAGLAGEFVLGLLSGPELDRAKRLFESDESFRSEVAHWSGQLAPMLDSVPGVRPPQRAWAGIEAAIGGTGLKADSREPGVRESGNIHVLRRRLTLWRGVAGVMTALAASLGLFVMIRSPVQVPVAVPVSTPAAAPATPMVARLASDKAIAVVASWDPERRQLLLATAAGMPKAPDRSHELWVIPAGGKPRSLGLMPQANAALIRLPAEAIDMMRAGATIAVSVEPAGGSPTGAPTGPVVASGALKAA